MDVASADNATVASKCQCYLEILPLGYLQTYFLFNEIPLQLVSLLTVEFASSMNALFYLNARKVKCI